ncbi:MAG: type II toxin-antitoxin system Phd/YefM family antitoxin [Caldilineaceae bacterium]|jgi:prevent-host-death family protein|nr:type II toxin-antitoxin system Phd/YefM family antitoxin [Caldilineaceae bacterium]
MPISYSIAEARNNLASIVHDLEETPIIQLTRRGEPVALLVAQTEFQRLQAGLGNFWDAYTAFRSRENLEANEIGPETFADLRDRAPGREAAW